MYILGISSYYHDSAAVLIKNGKIVAASEEERFTRIKHDNSFPINAISFCLSSENITSDDLDIIAYYEKPLLKFERILTTFVATYPYSLFPFIKTIPEWIGEKIKVEQKIRKELKYKGKLMFIPHHLSHASASYFTSPFRKAAVLTIDGVGEHQTTALWTTKNNKITLLKELNFPNSLGLLYSTFTAFLGFRVNEDEYKVMGMAAYGKPLYKENIYQLMDLKPDGSFELDMKYFSFRESFQMWNNKFENLFGKPRLSNQRISKKHLDTAASIQLVTEEIMFMMINHLYSLTKTKNLCLGGGVALNSLANGKIYKNTPFKMVHNLGAAGDGGAAAGAALFGYHLHANHPKSETNLKLGSFYSNAQIETELKKRKLKYKHFEDKNLFKKTADLLASGRIIGWFQDKSEFGPRALGSRSILASPYPQSMKNKVNIVKKRELFRPFAGSVLQEKANQYFEIPKTQNSFPFMNFCFVVRKNKRKSIPAITHKDGTCRIQTVSHNDTRYHMLIKEFYNQTKIPVVLNTSFNLKGEPIVETPKQAINDFLKSSMDNLVIGNFIVYK